MVNCSITGCKSRSDRNQPNITFHRFPREPVYKTKWIMRTGRVNWQPTKHSRICSRHFETNCFRPSKNGTYMYLKLRSVPTLFIPIQDEAAVSQPSTSECESLAMNIEARDFSIHHEPAIETLAMNIETRDFSIGDSFMTDDLSSSLPLEVAMEIEIESTSAQENVSASKVDITPRKIRLLKRLEKKTIVGENRRKKLAALRSKTWRLQKKTAELSAVIEELKTRSLINQETADLLSSIDVTNRDFLRKFLCKETTQRKYTPELRKFALSLHYISPKAYDHVRKTFNSCLPHPRTLSRWYQCIDGEPGFSTESIKAVKLLHEMKKKLDTSHKTICALSFDEMAIRRGLDFDGKKCIGFVNFGNNVDNDQLAKDALVFMLTCVNGSWKIPLGYFLINGISAEQKANDKQKSLSTTAYNLHTKKT